MHVSGTTLKFAPLEIVPPISRIDRDLVAQALEPVDERDHALKGVDAGVREADVRGASRGS